MKAKERKKPDKAAQLQAQTIRQTEPDMSRDETKTEAFSQFASELNTENTETVAGPDRIVKKYRDGVILEQMVQYVPGKGKPIVHARVRLTTAIRGKRKQDGLIEAAYLLRLEVLETSQAVRVEGLQLGPWQMQDLNLETGSLYLAAPLWTGFQPYFGPVKARVIIGDVARNRLLDLPLKITAVIPGPEPFGG